MRILIVEDDAASRSLMEVLLVAYGQCSMAENGLEAVELFEKALEENQPFKLICLDIMMPVLDGLEALKRIREIEKSHSIDSEKGVAVIMTTTVSQKSKVMRSFHEGCSGYLVKPISKDALEKEMKKLHFPPSMFTQWREF